MTYTVLLRVSHHIGYFVATEPEICMEKRYRYISPEARLRIHQLLLQGLGIQEIALQLGYHRSTLSI